MKSLRSNSVLPLAFTVFGALFWIDTAVSQLAYSEFVEGDLGDANAATSIGTLLLGTNTVTGRLENINTGMDVDTFSFIVAEDQELVDLSMASLTGKSRFLAFNEGPVDQFSGLGNLFATLISDSDVGTNILDGTLNDYGGSGTAGSLGPGIYSVWFQETDGTNVDYSFALTVRPVSIPEPSGILAMSSLFSGAARRRRQ